MKVRRYELLVDLEGCELGFTKKNIDSYIGKLCKLIGMQKHGNLVVWKDSHNKMGFLRGGISAFQFIKTSSIVIHSFEKSKQCFVDIFSCRDFDFDGAAKFSKEFFKAKKARARKIRN